jgi:hydrogenase maturation protease
VRRSWEELERRAPDAVEVDGVEIRRRSRVLLRPRPGGDVFDVALAGRTAVVEEVVQGVEGAVQLAVTVEDDPGRDLGEERQIGHRFFFSPEEVEPIEGAAPAGPQRILVAGIGNVFMGDDGFGVEVAQILLRTELPAGVQVEDYGIRGMDLAFALRDYDLAIFVDATPRGERPGTLYVIEPELDEEEPAAPEGHGMDPVKVLALARALGDPLPRVVVVGCEPATRMTGEEDEVVAELSEPVRAAAGEAARMVEKLIKEAQER